jgi:class 3 adenylate cyclase
MQSNLEHDQEIVAQYLQKEINSSLRKGGFIAMVFGFIAGITIFALMFLNLAENLALPGVFAFVGGSYSFIIYILAKKDKMRGWVNYAVFITFVLMPTALFIITHFTLPAGAATFITGGYSYLYFALIAVTGLVFNGKLSVIASIVAGAGYLFIYFLAEEQLLLIKVSDETFYQDLTSFPIYMFKSWMMVFTGLLVAAHSVISKRLILRILKEESEKSMISKLFGEYVSNEVREKILNEKTSIIGERKKVAVLFSDIRNFSTFSERLSPEEIVTHLNEYFDKMVESITSEGGVVDKFIGDAVMGVFGGLINLENSCDSALNSAILMRKGLNELNQKWKEQGLNTFENGIGIHYGEVLEGPIGSKNRKEFTVIGDSVNIASRIEGLTKEYAYKILITDSFYYLLSDKYKSLCIHLGKVKVKGKENEVEIYGVNE